MPPNLTTGTYNKFTTFIAIFILMVFYFFNRIKLSRNTIIFSSITIIGISASHFILSGELEETGRYLTLIIIMFLVGQTKTKNIDINWICRIMLIFSFLFTLWNLISGTARVTGFLMSSPTLFSFIVLIALTYLIFTDKTKFDIFLIIIGTWIIYETGSRSTLLVLLFFIVVFAFQKLYPRINFQEMKYKNVIKYGLILILLVVLFVLGKNVLDGSLLGREAGHESTNTRLKFLLTGANYLLDNPLKLIFGSGAGFSYELISELTGKHIPIHFDLLAVLIDFGLPGLITMLLLPFFLVRSWSWQAWILLLLGSIHNLMLFPIGLAFVILISNHLNTKDPKLF